MNCSVINFYLTLLRNSTLCSWGGRILIFPTDLWDRLVCARDTGEINDYNHDAVRSFTKKLDKPVRPHTCIGKLLFPQNILFNLLF